VKILLIGATGMVGSRIAAEARSRGHQVTGVTRSGADGTAKADVSDAATIAELASGHDAVVSAISPPRDGSEVREPLFASWRSLHEGLRKSGVRRLLMVGGAGSLLVPPGVRLVDTPDFPAIYHPEASAHADLLELIRAEADDLDWTYISPAAEIAPGERTGNYQRGTDQLLVNAEGHSSISAEDYAIGLVDELEQGKAIKQRITFAN
jgi:putative NADH-flavin reductase